MNEKKFRTYLKSEWKRIEIDKWIAGERTHSDPGDKYTESWIQKFGKWFRDSWEVSCCQTCKKCDDCGYNVRTECIDFSQGNDE